MTTITSTNDRVAMTQEIRQWAWDNFKRVNLFESCHYGGVYMLVGAGSLFGDRVEYIGSCIDIQNRLKGNHHRYKPEIHSVFVLRLSEKELKDREVIEYRLIQAFNPKLNIIRASRKTPYERPRLRRAKDFWLISGA